MTRSPSGKSLLACLSAVALAFPAFAAAPEKSLIAATDGNIGQAAALCERCAAKPKHAAVPAPREMKFTEGTFLWRGIYIPKKERVSGIPAEDYELSVKANGVTLRFSDSAGEFYAL